VSLQGREFPGGGGDCHRDAVKKGGHKDKTCLKNQQSKRGCGFLKRSSQKEDLYGGRGNKDVTTGKRDTKTKTSQKN